MTNDEFLSRLEHTLRSIETGQDRITELLGEVRSHLEETGDDPVIAFGEPERYAFERTGVDPQRYKSSFGSRALAVWLWLVAVSTMLGGVWPTIGSAPDVVWRLLLSAGAGLIGWRLWRRHPRLGPGVLRRAYVRSSVAQRAILMLSVAAIVAAVGFTLLPYETDGRDCGYAWAAISKDDDVCRQAAEDRTRSAVVVGGGAIIVLGAAFALLGSPRSGHEQST